MKQNDIFAALSFVDDELTERAQELMTSEHKSKKHITWKRLALAAACVCLCLTILLTGMRYGAVRPVHIVTNIPAPRPLTNLHWQCMEPTTSVVQPQIDSFCRFFMPPEMTVVAKVAEVLPDTYSDPYIYAEAPANDMRYHILRLQVEQVVTGKGIPKELYLCIDAEASTDLDEYDQMIFSICQWGYGNYRMINETTGCYEDFSPCFYSGLGNYSYSHIGSILAFTNGILDTSLWEKEGWLVPQDDELFWAGSDLDNILEKKEDYSNYSAYPAYDGCTIEECIQFIQSKRHGIDGKGISMDRKYIPYGSIRSWQAQKAMSYISEGDFVSHLYNVGKIVYFRVINGLITRESIQVDMKTGKVTYYGESFSLQEIEMLPDLSKFLEQLDLSEMTPPISPDIDMSDKVLYDCQAKGWYTKYKGEVYGVVEIDWGYHDSNTLESSSHGHPWLNYHEVLYYLFMTDGTVKELNGEQLREYIGDDVEIEDYKYY